MSQDRPLPEPDSEELFSLLGPSALRTLYGWLYRRRESNPPTMAEARLFVADAIGEPQEHVDRRLRELRRHFELPAVPQPSGPPCYQMQGWAATAATPGAFAISGRVRAQVLAPQRCFQCGKTPKDDGVRLVVDHKIPQSWGGGREIENLQPLCESATPPSATTSRATTRTRTRSGRRSITAEPQRRIGELLKAFDGEWVRTDLLAIVASAQEYQQDWQRRLRDLRFLGWDIEFRRTFNEGFRVWTYYRLKHAEPWPENIRDALTAEAQRRKRAKRAASDDRA